MTMFQIVMVALGCLLGVSAFWDKIKAGFSSIKWPKKPIVDEVEKVKPAVILNDPEKDFIKNSELVDTVEQWQTLVEMCDAQGLHSAKANLEEIFPLFVVTGGVQNEV